MTEQCFGKLRVKPDYKPDEDRHIAHDLRVYSKSSRTLGESEQEMFSNPHEIFLFTTRSSSSMTLEIHFRWCMYLENPLKSQVPSAYV